MRSSSRRAAFRAMAGRVLVLATGALALARPAHSATGGPDRFGYTWKDSAEPGVAYVWEDIGPAGVDLTLTGDDFNVGFQALSFPFPYYGNSYTTVAICSNGWVSVVDDMSTAYRNSGLPNPLAPVGTIAAYWDDLYCTEGQSRILFQDLGTRAVITWENIHDYSDITRQDTFQVILEADGRIRVQIRSILSSATSATLGIESPADDDGLTVFWDPAAGAPTTDYAVEFAPPGGIANRLDCPGALPLRCGAAVSGDLRGGGAVQGRYGCTALDYAGAEQIYRLDLTVQTSARLDLVMGSGDADIILLSACDPNRCLTAPADTIALVGVIGTYFVVVDSLPGQEGTYELRAECVDCPAAVTVTCGSVVTGDLASGNPGTDEYGCASGLTGREIAYRLDSATPMDVRLDLTELSGNPDLLVLDGCDPSRCERIDSGSLTLSGIAGTRYLVVDCEAGREGAYRLEVECLGDDFTFCGGGATFLGDAWASGNGAWAVSGWTYPVSDTGSFTLRVDGTDSYSNDASDCPLLAATSHAAVLPAGPASVTWESPLGSLQLDALETEADGCCGLLVRLAATNTDTVPHSYEFRIYHDTAFGMTDGTCASGVVDAGPVQVGGVTYTTEQDLLALGADRCDRQLVMFSAEDPATPRAAYEMLPPNLPTVMELIQWDDGGRPCAQWSGFANDEGIAACEDDNSILLAWRFPQGSGTLAPGETATASYRIGLRCTWPCDLVCEDPVLGSGSAVDIRPCSRGLYLEWEPATFPGAGGGVYHVYRSTDSFAAALAARPVTPSGGIRVPSFADSRTLAGQAYFYVVQAESTEMPGCGPGPLVSGSTAELDLGPVVDQELAGGPAGLVGAALRVSTLAADAVRLDWSLSPPPGSQERYVVLRSDDNPEGGFAARASVATAAWDDIDAPARFDPVHVWYYDVRMADDCGNLSLD